MVHASPRYAYRCPADFGRREAHHAVAIIGGGLVGLTVALDLARHGVRSVLVDEEDTVSTGSRAICFAKRTLEIYGRLGLGPRMLAKGVTWHVGKVFHRDRQLFTFDLLPEAGHEYPAFINLQQYYAEEWLVAACAETGLVDLRWRNTVVGVESHPDHVALEIETPDGRYRITADWLLACDGARSFVRGALGLPFTGQVFRDHFLIADVVMQADFPTERWFWFDPPFHRGQSALLHKQPDNVWRIDFQLGPDAKAEVEKRPERVIPRVRAMLGPDVPFELEWVSVYTFCCRRLDRFVHGRTVFLGDSAHQVSPFGARGGNGGVQDADNLAWKLAAVLHGDAPVSLIDSYEAERIPAADENILHSTRTTDFLTPKSDAARAYRDAALALAGAQPFARTLINSGRLSCPAVLKESPLHVAGSDTWPGCPKQGTAAVDAPVERDGRPDWLLHHLGGDGFTLLCFGSAPGPAPDDPLLRVILVTSAAGTAPPGVTMLHDRAGLASARYAAPHGAGVLIRPDQHVAACFARADMARVRTAMRCALGHGAPALAETV